MTLKIGKKRCLPRATRPVRVSPPPPTRNQTGPDCPPAQKRPSGSKSGFWGVGMDEAHSHHKLLHAPSVFPKTSSCAGSTETHSPPKTEGPHIDRDTSTRLATIHCLRHFICILYPYLSSSVR